MTTRIKAVEHNINVLNQVLFWADFLGESAPKELLREVLALTKMNVNNCAFADGVPITLSFSKKIGDIMKHIPEDGKVQPTYKFYM